MNDKKKQEELDYEIDWRGTNNPTPNCLNEPELDQGDCGCCYAMAMMGRFEWLHCKQQLESGVIEAPIKLSEQYLIDCGQPFELDGCSKGNVLGALKFVESAGVLPAQLMPFMGVESGECKLTNEMHQHVIKPQNVGHKLFKSQLEWLSELRARGPLVVYLKLSDDFFDYAGGLYEPQGVEQTCDPELGHFMLLVGHGRERASGRPFWLLANSFGRDYGESGYIRVPAPTGEDTPKSGGDSCLLYAVAADAEFNVS